VHDGARALGADPERLLHGEVRRAQDHDPILARDGHPGARPAGVEREAVGLGADAYRAHDAAHLGIDDADGATDAVDDPELLGARPACDRGRAHPDRERLDAREGRGVEHDQARAGDVERVEPAPVLGEAERRQGGRVEVHGPAEGVVEGHDRPRKGPRVRRLRGLRGRGKAERRHGQKGMHPVRHGCLLTLSRTARTATRGAEKRRRSRPQGCCATTTVWIPPRTRKSPSTTILRGARARTRSSRIRLVTASWKCPWSRKDQR
jgi:hypothetical protein